MHAEARHQFRDDVHRDDRHEHGNPTQSRLQVGTRHEAEPPAGQEPVSIRVAIITLDGHLGNTVAHAEQSLRHEIPGLELSLHASSEWGDDPVALEACLASIEQADILICTMLFLDPHIRAVLPALEARRDRCDALVGAMSGMEIVKLTRMGKLSMGGELKGPMVWLKKLRGSKKSGQSNGHAQMKALRRLPKILKYIPGTAQDLRIYFITLQCWLAGSEENVVCLVRTLVRRYASGPREILREQLDEKAPVVYPDTGLYHPRMPGRIDDRLSELPRRSNHRGRIGLLLMRSYLLAENRQHYDAVIESLEARGLEVVPAFASGLDARPAIDRYFVHEGRPTIDCLISLTGFSLVGGPAYNDAASAVEALKELDIPYLAAHASEFQSLDQWQSNVRGLTPIETTLMIALPELDGATAPTVFAGQQHLGGQEDQNKSPILERVERLADRAQRLVTLRRRERHDRQLGIVLFNFPPNAGAVGTAAYLSVFESLFNTLVRLANEGYDLDVPDSPEHLRALLLEGNAGAFGTDANVLATVPTDDHVRHTPWLEEIEREWGPAPGKLLTNGQGLHILGISLGKVTIALQPGFGHEGDPMRLLFDGGFTPTHAFSAFYRYLTATIPVDALLHFGTHGALEFMPGKQAGLSGVCWPERLLGSTPNVYLYAANNPSEATIAKRRSAATTVSYLTPSVTEAGLYRGLADLKSALTQWQQLDAHESLEALELLDLIQKEASELEIGEHLDWSVKARESSLLELKALLLEYEQELIPCGMHVLGELPTLEERVDLMHACLSARQSGTGPATTESADADAEARPVDRDSIRQLLEAVTSGAVSRDDASDPDAELQDWQRTALEMNRHLLANDELDGLMHALDGGYIAPVAGGDLLRSPETLPAGRNIHGFDPFRLPTALAQRQGERQADRLLERHKADTGRLPRSIAFVLWGSDNLKNEGVPIAQVLALMGARPRFDGFGKLCGAELVPLDELGRPRIDVLTTLSGVFRDLLPLQIRMLAEAALLASEADEPLEQNFVRQHSLDYQARHDCDMATAALRVFSNADGAYGANVNLLIDSGAWQGEDELADTYANRKCFAYDVDGRASRQGERLEAALATIDIAYQNLESVELGVTQLDYYFDTLGGINAMVRKARGTCVPTYIGDQTRGNGDAGTVRTLKEQVALETRTRVLNPKWYEGQLKHGYEGVRSIETSMTNTLGWSATTGQVSEWVYNQMAQTFVLDRDMRDRLATLNPTASARMANRLLEASERNYWTPSDEVLQALQDAGDELEDRLEGVMTGAVA